MVMVFCLFRFKVDDMFMNSVAQETDAPQKSPQKKLFKNDK